MRKEREAKTVPKLNGMKGRKNKVFLASAAEAGLEEKYGVHV